MCLTLLISKLGELMEILNLNIKEKEEKIGKKEGVGTEKWDGRGR